MRFVRFSASCLTATWLIACSPAPIAVAPSTSIPVKPVEGRPGGAEPSPDAWKWQHVAGGLGRVNQSVVPLRGGGFALISGMRGGDIFASPQGMVTSRDGTEVVVPTRRSFVTWQRNDTGYDAQVGTLLRSRLLHSAVTMPDGKILVIGGERTVSHQELKEKKTAVEATSTTEWIVPGKTSAESGPDLVKPRAYASAVVLADGTVVVFGGYARTTSAMPNGSQSKPGNVTSIESLSPGASKFVEIGATPVDDPIEHVVKDGPSSALLVGKHCLYTFRSGSGVAKGPCFEGPRTYQAVASLEGGGAVLAGMAPEKNLIPMPSQEVEVWDGHALRAAGKLTTAYRDLEIAVVGEKMVAVGHPSASDDFAASRPLRAAQSERFDLRRGQSTKMGAVGSPSFRVELAALTDGSVVAAFDTGEIHRLGAPLTKLAAPVMADDGPLRRAPAASSSEFSNVGWLDVGMSGNHSLSRLPNGDALAVSGSTARVYKSASKTWTPAPSLAHEHFGHAAASLGDGRVMVIGGFSAADKALAVTEVYDPASNTWTAGPSLTHARSELMAVTLTDGRVLVAGGNQDPTAEVWDPKTNAFTSAGKVPSTSSAGFGNMVALRDGGALFMPAYGSAQRWNPKTSTWAAAGKPLASFEGFRLVLLNDGRVLCVGGAGGKQSEVWNPATNSWQFAASMRDVRLRPGAVALADGRVLAVGGYRLAPGGSDRVTETIATAEIWDPKSGWTKAGPMKSARQNPQLTLLPNGDVLIVGGLGPAIDDHEASNDDTALTSVEVRRAAGP